MFQLHLRQCHPVNSSQVYSHQMLRTLGSSEQPSTLFVSGPALQGRSAGSAQATPNFKSNYILSHATFARTILFSINPTSNATYGTLMFLSGSSSCYVYVSQKLLLITQAE